MRKIIIGFSALLISAFVVIMVANAQNGTQDTKKATSETAKDCSKCPSASSCGHMKYGAASEAKKCDPAKCKELGCDPAKCKEGMCDKSKCKAAAEGTASCVMKKMRPA